MYLSNPYLTRSAQQQDADNLSQSSLASSILSVDNFNNMESIKQSITQPRDKEVMLLTPVILGNQSLSTTYEPTKLSYKLGDRFNMLVPPAVQTAHTGGLIIRMPLEGCKLYLERLISILVLPSDETLVTDLNQKLNSNRFKPVRLPPAENLEMNIR